MEKKDVVVVVVVVIVVEVVVTLISLIYLQFHAKDSCEIGHYNSNVGVGSSLLRYNAVLLVE